MDTLRNAYATLELSPGASAREVRRQFKKLVRRWHPDRFAEDPVGQAEAAGRMSAINAAYRLIQGARAAPTAPPGPPAHAPTVEASEPREPVTRPLGRGAIDGIVRSMGTASPVDTILGVLAWSWPLFVAVAITFTQPYYSWQDWAAGRPRPSYMVRYWQLLLVALALLLRFRRRRTHQ
jgi:hypothetical protein